MTLSTSYRLVPRRFFLGTRSLATIACFIGIAVASAFAGVALPFSMQLGNAVISACLGVVCVLEARRPARSLGKETILGLLVGSAIFSIGAIFPAIPVPLLGLAVVAVSINRARLNPIASPLFNLPVLLVTALFSVAAGAGIYLWWVNLPGLHFLEIIPDWFPSSTVAVVLLCICASAVNALYEEFLWRKVFVATLSPIMGWAPAVLFISAAFGVAHLTAMPSGPLGMLLTFCFALTASVIVRWRNGSLATVVIAHFVADLTALLLLAGV